MLGGALALNFPLIIRASYSTFTLFRGPHLKKAHTLLTYVRVAVVAPFFLPPCFSSSIPVWNIKRAHAQGKMHQLRATFKRVKEKNKNSAAR